MDDPRSQLIDCFVKLTRGCPIAQLGPPYRYYYASESKSNILAIDLIEIDVKAAFPTICKILFGADSPFVQHIFSIDDKLKRNIFISTSLTEETKKNGYPYINELNLWSKMLILAYAYSKYDNINILEYVKDGMLIKGEPLARPSQEYYILNDFIKKYDVQFHEKQVPLYCFFNRTSLYQKEDNTIKIKGQYHNPPEYLNSTLSTLLSGSIYNHKFLNEIKQVYSRLFFNILFKSAIKTHLDHYYKFDDGKYITADGKLGGISQTSPKGYLTEIIYPVLSLLRLRDKS